MVISQIHIWKRKSMNRNILGRQINAEKVSYTLIISYEPLNTGKRMGA